jgi:Concanavalin A-like lectin/glucanases superfamily
MNITVIILGITLIVLIYVLYLYLSPGNNVLSKTAALNVAPPPITSIQSPTSSRYSYGIWIYINTWDSSQEKVIFSRDKNLKLYLDKTSPTLYLDVTMNDASTQTVMITDNFFIQKWVHILISVDNSFFDFYLDGKLVKSQKLFTASNGTTAAVIPATPGDTTVPILLGATAIKSTTYDAYVARFIRWTEPLNPQTVWNTYMQGNGNSWGIFPNLSAYNADVSILKNNIEFSKFQIF